MEATADFITQLLNTGGTLARLAESLISTFVADGKEPDTAEADVLEVIAGTIAVGLATVPAADLARATELMELAMQAVMGDLQRALEQAIQRQAGTASDR